MLIEIHVIQNHSPANLNRDDLGAPKTCLFGGVLRSRISSQCLKRSIRMSDQFKSLLGGVRTRQLARLITDKLGGNADIKKRAEKVLSACGFKPKQTKKGKEDEEGERSKMLVYTSREAIDEMVKLLQEGGESTDNVLPAQFAALISERVAVPDMALSGRMLEPDKSAKEVWKNHDTTVEAALQVAHALSTHEAHPEVDYYVAADDIPGEDAGAGYVDEAMFGSACFYKYLSIHWETLVENLKENKDLAAHTVGALIRSIALTNPTGKQNSFAAHNPPDGMLIQFSSVPISYANAFVDPVRPKGDRAMVSQSIAQLGHYVHDLDVGYGPPLKRFWFSPNLRFRLTALDEKKEMDLADENVKSLDDLVRAVICELGFDWAEVQNEVLKAVVSEEDA
ncbi:MAG TPA: type I-E CRISPR-associated protein Cas7/Cse4/CasC [Candidatus Hydrogenedentes bacterium]|nr:type I-E CRISPR-associated protein Cas7/Cse4/CasC [Candidatus Hydrogenedentota bacterium]